MLIGYAATYIILQVNFMPEVVFKRCVKYNVMFFCRLLKRIFLCYISNRKFSY